MTSTRFSQLVILGADLQTGAAAPGRVTGLGRGRRAQQELRYSRWQIRMRRPYRQSMDEVAVVAGWASAGDHVSDFTVSRVGRLAHTLRGTD